MRRWELRSLRCPVCRGALEPVSGNDTVEIRTGELRCACGERWPVRGQIPDLVYPPRLLPSDAEFRRKYDEGARRYQTGLNWLFRSFHEDEITVRERLVDLLELRPGQRALDVGGGTGSDSLHISSRLGPGGELFVLELSSGMLRLARRRLARVLPRTSLVLGNGAYLPFDDGHFDAVFHFGGINEFGDVRRALAEMTRVTKRGGKVVVGDEGVAPWLRHRRFGRILAAANPLYRHRPPLGALPVGARDVSLRWILGNAFYVIDYRVGDGPPPLDIDLPIPGKGDSLRSRYYGRERPG